MKTLILPLCLVILVGYGCVEPIPAPPHTLAEYTAIQRTHPQEYANSTVMQYNIQRVLDPDLPVEQRDGSLDLITSLVGPNGQYPAEIATILTQNDLPPTLRKRILTKGVGTATVATTTTVAVVPNSVTPPPVSNGTDVSRLPLSQLSQAPAGPKRRALLRWLIDHPRREVLSDLTKLWASEAPNGPDEQLFRQAIAKLGAGQWADVLLNSLNATKFAARGSALVILSGRGAEIDLLNRVKQISAKTVSVKAMRIFAQKFGYVPSTGGDLLACIIIQAQNENSLGAPAR